MRARELLTEKQDYLAMTQRFIDAGRNELDIKQRTFRISHALKQIRLKLKRKDRIVAYINFWRNNFDYPNETFGNQETLTTILNLLNTFKHYLDMGIPEIENYTWSHREGVFTLQARWAEIVRVWKKSNSGWVTPSDKAAIMFRYNIGGKTFAWVDLNVSGDRAEGAAMGHCGNGTGRTGETVLSFREIDKKRGHRPCLTFVLQTQDGMLGEMKGRGNSKPAEKYWPYIVDLLKRDSRIQGISGTRSYMPENDFKVSWLPQEQIDELVNLKPKLLSASEYVRNFGFDEAMLDEIDDYVSLGETVTVDGIEYYGYQGVETDFFYGMWEDKVKLCWHAAEAYDPEDPNNCQPFFGGDTIYDDAAHAYDDMRRRLFTHAEGAGIPPQDGGEERFATLHQKALNHFCKKAYEGVLWKSDNVMRYIEDGQMREFVSKNALAALITEHGLEDNFSSVLEHFVETNTFAEPYMGEPLWSEFCDLLEKAYKLANSTAE